MQWRNRGRTILQRDSQMQRKEEYKESLEQDLKKKGIFNLKQHISYTLCKNRKSSILICRHTQCKKSKNDFTWTKPNAR